MVGNQHVRPMALALRHHAVLKPASSSSEDVNFRSARSDPSKNSISPRAMASSRRRADRTASSAQRRERPRRRPTYENDSPRVPGPSGRAAVALAAGGTAGGLRPPARASPLACLGCPGALSGSGNSSALPLALTSAHGGGQRQIIWWRSLKPILMAQVCGHDGRSPIASGLASAGDGVSSVQPVTSTVTRSSGASNAGTGITIRRPRRACTAAQPCRTS